MRFQINDSSTDSTNPAVFITITESANGTLAFSVDQAAGIIGDLRGLFFDVNAIADGVLAKSLSISNASAPATLKTGDDSIKDLGNGSNMNGLLGSDGGYDAGINIGSAGLGTDDIRTFSFTLASSLRSLTLDDFGNVDFGARLTSVGTLGGSRANSSKLLETTSVAINANDDAATVVENNVTSGNLLSNDTGVLGTGTVASWSGGTLGTAIVLAGAAGTTLTVNANGTYTLDASTADALSAGESFTYNYSYDANSSSPDQTSSDSANFTVTVSGVNDAPVAQDDNAGRINEGEIKTGNVSVLGNDSDIDRLDTFQVSAINGNNQAVGTKVTLASGAAVTLNADGTYNYDSQSAFNYLNTGQSATDSFEYTISDGNGGFDTAIVTIAIDGISPITPPPPPPPPPPVDPIETFLFNHGSGRFDHGFFPQSGQDNTAEGFTGNDTLKIAGYGDAQKLTISTGNFTGIGDAGTPDTKFVIEILGNDNSTRTYDEGFLVDFTGLTTTQIVITGQGGANVTIPIEFV